MKAINAKNQLIIDLYHGTSTVFLDSIIQNGLGGINPVIEWNMIELAKETLKLAEEHLSETELFQRSSYSFRQMTLQANSGAFNWQHGEVYLSPSEFAAAQYAINKEYGSEILSYIIMFLKELIKAKIKHVTGELFRKYPKVFGLIEAKPSPLLIQAGKVNVSSLRDEHGNPPIKNLELITNVLESKVDISAFLQQCNFRLSGTIEKNRLKFWLINVQQWNPFRPTYNLYPLDVDGARQ